MRISDWSSDVCSSDLAARAARDRATAQARAPVASAQKAANDLTRYQALQKLDPAAVAGQQLDQARAQARTTAAEAAAANQAIEGEIGRASCRERGCQYV